MSPRKRVLINLDALRQHPDCPAQCSYPHRKPGQLAGPAYLMQRAGFEVFCRRCDDHPCVNACPNEALEQLEGGLIKRHNFRCTQCNSCMVACPFGTIVPAALAYHGTMCDFCVGRENPAPLCVQTCNCGVFMWEDIPDVPEDATLHVVGERFAVRVKSFTKVEPAPRGRAGK